MKCSVIVVLMVASHVHATHGTSPVQKVIQMLGDMLSKAKEQMHEGEVEFVSHKQFCESATKTKQRAIEEGKETIEQLDAVVGKAKAEILMLAKDIAALDSDVSSWEADKKTELSLRAKAHEDYIATHKEYTQSIESIELAIVDLKKRQPATGSAQMSFVELQSLAMSARTKRVVMSFLQRSTQGTDLFEGESESSASDAATDDSASRGLIEMVEKLESKFREELARLEKEEANQAHTSDMKVQDLTNQVEAATEERHAKAATKAKKEQQKAESSGDSQDTADTVRDDKNFLSDLQAECDQRARDFESSQEMRQSEIEAIQKAVDILSGDIVVGSEKHLQSAASFFHSSFIQVRTLDHSSMQMSVANFLQQRGRHIDSRILALLGAKAANEPLKKVAKMIKDMVVKLLEQANEDAEHKGFCDSELGTNKQSRDENTEKVELLNSQIETLSADIAQIAEDMVELTEDISSTNEELSKATEQRQEEKAKNKAIAADSKAAYDAVSSAIQILSDFYAEVAGPALLQQQPAMGEHWWKKQSFVQMQSHVRSRDAGGVIGMLEIIQSDFARLETDTNNAESKAADAFEKFSSDAAANKSAKNTDLEHKKTAKVEKESAMARAKKDLLGTHKELKAAMEYYEKLRPSCVDAGDSYEDRVMQRKEEIESLQEALKMLNSEAN
jgi:DNA repair exonuclease SbcCD ATPase subunit